MDYHKLCFVAVNYIKNKIGLSNDNFDTYKKFMNEKGISGEKIFRDILSDCTLTKLLRNAKIRDLPDKRKNPHGPSKNRLRSFNCLLVISLILLICYNYECLRKNIREIKNLSDKQIRNLIKVYVPYLKKLNPNYNITKWLPNSKRLEYSFDKIKQLVKQLGTQLTGKPGIILKPKTKKQFDALRMKLNLKPTLIPIVVKCGCCGNIWPTNGDRLQQNKWCTICRKNVYTFSKTKNLVEKIGLNKTGIKGILRKPKNREEFIEIKERLGCWYGRIPLKVECGCCGNIWSTNAERLQQNHWCPTCAEGEYEQICRWYLEKILSFIFKLRITCPQTRLYRVIKCYNENNYNELEKKIIEDLIKFGHVDCYCEIKINCTILKLALEYQGGQHNKIITKFHNTLDDLKHQKLLDKFKRRLCRENKIVLIEFPYDIDKYMSNSIKIQNYIVQELKSKANIKIPIKLPLFNHNTPEFGQYRLDHYL